jgi:signal transduction histidine kinase
MIERVLSNLIRNAIEYTDEGGEISVAVELRGAEVTVAVRDTGCCIAAEDLPMVTQRFYRVDKSRRPGGGMGLGLAIVEMILTLHGARLSIQSKVTGRQPAHGCLQRLISSTARQLCQFDSDSPRSSYYSSDLPRFQRRANPLSSR